MSGLEVGEMVGEDVKWEESVAISEPSAEGEKRAPELEQRITDGLPDVPPPDELVVASGTLRWPEETGALTDRSEPIPPPPAPEVSPTAGVQRRKSHAFRTFVLLVLLALLAGAGFNRYRERLMPYVETYVEPYAGPTISRVRTFVEDQLDRLIGVDEPEGDWAEPAFEDPVLQPEPGPSKEPVRRPVISEFSQIDRISWEELAGETLLILWTNGPVRRDQVELARMETGGVRAITKIVGVERQPDQSNIAVGTSHVERIRTGLHQGPVGSVLHIVADLTDAGVYVRAVEPQGSRLEIYFARR